MGWLRGVQDGELQEDAFVNVKNGIGIVAGGWYSLLAVREVLEENHKESVSVQKGSLGAHLTKDRELLCSLMFRRQNVDVKHGTELEYPLQMVTQDMPLVHRKAAWIEVPFRQRLICGMSESDVLESPGDRSIVRFMDPMLPCLDS